MTHRIDVELVSASRVVITLGGELDAFAAPELRRCFHETIAQESPDVLVADLRSVPFLDSTALGVIVGALRQLREHGAELRIVLPDSPARRIFEVTALDRVLPVYESRAEALAG